MSMDGQPAGARATPATAGTKPATVGRKPTTTSAGAAQASPLRGNVAGGGAAGRIESRAATLLDAYAAIHAPALDSDGPVPFEGLTPAATSDSSPWRDPLSLEATDASRDDSATTDRRAGTGAHPLHYEPDETPPPPLPGGGGWTLPLLCAGLAILAACVIIPQADANRRILYERQKLKLDLQQIQEQVAVNDEFLKKLETEPELAERLARRQMRVIREGEKELPLRTERAAGIAPMSPFLLTRVPPPAPLPPYKPVGGTLADWCRDSQTKLYLMGGALMLVAMGLVLGTDSTPSGKLPGDASRGGD